jgi:hypothetical protein
MLLGPQFAAFAQQSPLTIQDAVNRSLASYPAVRSSMEQVAAAATVNPSLTISALSLRVADRIIEESAGSI